MNIKLFFSLLVIGLSFKTFARGEVTQRPLFKISYDQNREMADKAQEILQKDYGIPQGFIHFERQSHPCQRDSSDRKSLLHVCLRNSGEHQILKAKTKVLKRSFQALRD